MRAPQTATKAATKPSTGSAGTFRARVNRFWKLNLDERGRFKAPEQLRAEYEALMAGRTPPQLILQCGSGVTACHDLLALHVAQLPGAALFAGFLEPVGGRSRRARWRRAGSRLILASARARRDRGLKESIAGSERRR